MKCAQVGHKEGGKYMAKDSGFNMVEILSQRSKAQLMEERGRGTEKAATD